MRGVNGYDYGRAAYEKAREVERNSICGGVPIKYEKAIKTEFSSQTIKARGGLVCKRLKFAANGGTRVKITVSATKVDTDISEFEVFLNDKRVYGAGADGSTSFNGVLFSKPNVNVVKVRVYGSNMNKVGLSISAEGLIGEVEPNCVLAVGGGGYYAVKQDDEYLVYKADGDGISSAERFCGADSADCDYDEKDGSLFIAIREVFGNFVSYTLKNGVTNRKTLDYPFKNVAVSCVNGTTYLYCTALSKVFIVKINGNTRTLVKTALKGDEVRVFKTSDGKYLLWGTKDGRKRVGKIGSDGLPVKTSVFDAGKIENATVGYDVSNGVEILFKSGGQTAKIVRRDGVFSEAEKAYDEDCVAEENGKVAVYVDKQLIIKNNSEV